jgi:hypothetical protein
MTTIHYADQNFKIELIDEIIFVEWLKEEYDYEEIDFIIKKRIELCAGKSFPIFTDLRKLKKGTRQSRERLAGMDAGIGVSAVAVLVGTRVQKTLFNFFNAIYKAPAPTRLFTNKESALQWLRQYINK